MTPAPLYLDHASTTPCAPEVVAAMQPYWTDQCGNAAAAGMAGRQAFRMFEQARNDIAGLIGGTGEGVILTSGATEANDLALRGAAQVNTDKSRNEILISAVEHDSVFYAARDVRALGYDIKIIPVDACGIVTPAALAALLSPRTFMVSVIAAGHETGAVQNIPSLAAQAREAGALFHTDAAQAAGRMKIDVAAWGVDILTFCAHKMKGPQGIGALYLRSTPPLALHPVFGGGGAQKLRGGTVPLALAAGFGAACRLATAEMARGQRHAADVRAAFVDILTARGVDFTVNETAAQLPHILSLYMPGIDAADAMINLAPYMDFSAGAACRNAAGKTSAVLAAMGQDDVRAAQTMRFSFAQTAPDEKSAAQDLKNIAAAAEKLADYAVAACAGSSVCALGA